MKLLAEFKILLIDSGGRRMEGGSAENPQTAPRLLHSKVPLRESSCGSTSHYSLLPGTSTVAAGKGQRILLPPEPVNGRAEDPTVTRTREWKRGGCKQWR